MELLKLSSRKEHGKNQVDKLRAEGIVPGVIYGKDREPLNVSGHENVILKLFQEVGTSVIIEVEIDGQKTSVLFKEVQMHPFKNNMLHFDLYEIDMNHPITVVVPVVLIGRDEIKVQPSNLIQVINEVEVSCLPKYLPSTADVEVTDMQIGDTITVADLDISKDENIEVALDADEVVATLSAPREESEEEETEVAGEVPTVAETEQKESEEE
ncbi:MULTISPECIES: 50S ribosomal protein L25 [Peptoniphilus]|uniref:Large ribosomal subunit protein bL25 n=1 Tax=Peptoniphilus lacrimalis TaxID=33031 RepID=A0A379C5Q8_9FIRM|nr:MULTISPECIES: 50S ribosomal protein L25 [Peptoniphilus]EFK38796.1 ribosomal protein L25, Ctc-form [Peptoniphilus sp. oral taxon 836 str. F0141]SUB57682.1 General stress protein CTC [Peptoniphilus lacrimalis]